MSIKILYVACLMLLNILVPNSYAGISDFFKEITDLEKVRLRIKDEIQNLELITDVDLLNSQIIEGVGLGIQYKYELEPSYEAGFFTRADV